LLILVLKYPSLPPVTEVVMVQVNHTSVLGTAAQVKAVKMVISTITNLQLLLALQQRPRSSFSLITVTLVVLVQNSWL
jgi:hypothetical protein